jgi:hypothetical protein
MPCPGGARPVFQIIGHDLTEDSMRFRTIMTAAVAAIAAAAFVTSTPLSAQSAATPAAKDVAAPSAKTAAPAPVFATLKGVKAAPMASKELDAVKGLHVHFLDAGNGSLHLAGDVKTENNWENLGGSDGQPVAPSYHGLCIAAGLSGPGAGGISIPGGQFQCPL